MEFPEETIAIGAKGKKEARVLRSSGSDFAVYGYFDIETNSALSKYSILLKKNGGIEHLIIVPIAGKKEMVVKHEIEKNPKKRGIYDEKTKKIIFF